jgi:hypothetical protein
LWGKVVILEEIENFVDVGTGLERLRLSGSIGPPLSGPFLFKRERCAAGCDGTSTARARHTDLGGRRKGELLGTYISGSGKKADADQDQAKNNFCAPGPALPIWFDELRGLQSSVEANKKLTSAIPWEESLPFHPKAGPTKNRGPSGIWARGRCAHLKALS